MELEEEFSIHLDLFVHVGCSCLYGAASNPIVIVRDEASLVIDILYLYFTEWDPE